MIGILVIAHAPLAKALCDCAYHVYGAEAAYCANLAAFDVPAAGDTVVLLEEARRLRAGLDQGEGVLILTDLFGATPANLATQLARDTNSEVLCGVNLPMLLRALTYRTSTPLAALVEKAMSGASAGVMKIVSHAPQNQQLPLTEPGDATTRMHHHQ